MMDKPRPPHIVSEQIRDLDDVIAATREMLVRYPDDYSLRLGLNQDEAMKAVLLDELEESLAVYHHHSVQYIFKSEKNAIDLNILLTGLQTFKDLVDKTFELICKREVNLKFETVFSGSLGILLSTPYDEALINTDYEMGFKAVFNTLNRINNDDVDIHEIVKHDMKGNRKLIRKYARFFDSVIMSNK
ncbi:MAG: hypothetical protein GYA56_06410, partial [Geobacteraceae bacterium]|nr:hypothetical protein [Geobacteraceae bacterium]